MRTCRATWVIAAWMSCGLAATQGCSSDADPQSSYSGTIFKADGVTSITLTNGKFDGVRP
jgi:hypothetical protein